MKIASLGLAAAAAALLVTSACAPRRQRAAPPATATSGQTAQPGTAGQTGVTDPAVGAAVLPGSRADFVRSVPSDRVHFETDSHTLDAQARSILDAQAAYLQRHANVAVTIEGHADERGTREYNLALGERRANSVRAHLAARGIAAERMTTLSWGKERPVAEGSTEEAWARNRRAVTVLPE